MRSELPLAAAAALLLLSGCATGDGQLPYLGGPDNFGEANRQTMAAQVVDPDPVYDTAVPQSSAEHAGQAIERYRLDKVKQPDKMKTSDSKLGARDGGN